LGAGQGIASELIFTGDRIGAEEAVRVGLANRVVAPAKLMETARELAERIASRAPVTVAKAKAAILATQQLPLEKGLAFEVDRVWCSPPVSQRLRSRKTSRRNGNSSRSRSAPESGCSDRIASPRL
jgi:enoyl-CoA hydratase/carnithine racemase